MKIALYCQHVLGMGHLFRTLEILGALAGHDRLLLVGGPETPASVPEGTAVVRLPELAMDRDFTAFSVSAGELEARKAARREALLDALASFSPDVFFVELYPFGRKAFEFELLPALTALREKRFGPCRVVCGVRDILVEKADQAGYEARVLDRLGRFFDAVLVHADPNLFPFSATFSRSADIPVPLAYTGYVAATPQTSRRPGQTRHALGVEDGRELVAMSAGGGKVGAGALLAGLAACRRHPRLSRAAVRVFAGPFAADAEVAAMEEAAAGLDDARVVRFAAGFADILAAADLSLSLAGYNTVMGILAAGCRALVVPFDQNREQRMRAERLAALGLLGLVETDALDPSRLARRMVEALKLPPPPRGSVDLDGARRTAFLLTGDVLAWSEGLREIVSS